MIPILYEAGTTEYKTNGLGRLSDAISCNVTEERNGTYELSMTYPITGIHYADIAIDRIIYAEPADGKSAQPFRIYKISRPMSGQVEISAEHISYLLSKAIVMPFTATSAVDAFNKLSQNIVGADGFTFSTDKAVTANFTLDQPMDCRSLLGGTSGSILDTYGTGEYEFDGFEVTLHLHRGVDNGVTIRYGKNLTDATRTSDMSNVYTGIVPYATVDDVTYTLSERVVKSEHTGDFANPHYKVVDFSSRFGTDETPTEDKLRSYAETYVKNNEGWEISDNVSIEFAALWQTDEYKNMAIQRINLCDTIHVVYTDLGINVTAEVIKTDYDVLAGHYNSIEVGNSSTNLSKTITDAIDDATADVRSEVSALPSAIKKATEQITGGLGGYIVLKHNANGQPEELLIMDTDDVNTAVNVWRWNKGGLGHSHNGYDGPFDDVAITQDGEIVADYITTGTLNANLIKAGAIQDEAGNTTWDLASGALTSNKLSIKSANFMLTDDGTITSTAGTIGGFTIGKDYLAFGKTGLENNTGDGIFISKDGIAIGENGHGVPYLRGISSGSSLSSGFDKVTVQLLTIGGSSGQSHGSIDSWDGSDGNWSSGYSYGIQTTCKFHVGKSLDEKGDLYVDGDIKYKGDLKYGSDRRLKQNIKSLDNKAVDFILGLNPVSYEFIEAPEKVRHGFIAQEVQEIQYDGWTPVEIGWEGTDGENFLSLSYIELISDMVATIQYQNKRIDDLEQRLASLEERYANN